MLTCNSSNDVTFMYNDQVENIIRLLNSQNLDTPSFPPTLIYNEGWILRILLEWFSNNRHIEHRIRFQSGAKWFSEGQLPTPFKARYRGDKLAESRTNADGVIGQLIIGKEGKTDITLIPTATQFMIFEAKLFSKLSTGTKNAPGYDQAARNVACMAEVIKRTGMASLEKMSLGFYLLAPESQVSSYPFKEMKRESIQSKVKNRVESYKGDMDAWYKDWFLPLMNFIGISIITWEEVIDLIVSIDPKYGLSCKEFYEICLKVNG